MLPDPRDSGGSSRRTHPFLGLPSVASAPSWQGWGMTVSLDEVRAAAERIAGRVRRTPVLEVAPGLTFKRELLQHTGSFKPRGAFNRLLTAKESGELTGQGVVAASGGNAGLAAAYA